MSEFLLLLVSTTLVILIFLGIDAILGCIWSIKKRLDAIDKVLREKK